MDRYPTALVGLIASPDFLNSLGTNCQFVYKIDNTDRASTTTYADDPDLTVQLEANATYFVLIFGKEASITGVELKTNWTVPSGAAGSRACIGADQGVDLSLGTSGASGTVRSGVHNFTTTVRYGHRNSATNLAAFIEYGVVTTTNAGTLALSWAQNTSNATAVRVGNGSIMFVYRLV